MNLKKDINNIHDKSYKDLYSNKEVFIDLVKKTLNVTWVKGLKVEQLTLVNKSYISSDYEETESDIVYKAKVNGSEELFGDSIVDFKYNLFDVNNKYLKEELVKNKSITSAIFLLDQKIDPKEFLDRIKTIALFFDGLDEKELQVLKHWIENSVEDRLAKEAVKILSSSKEEVESMVASNAYIITEMEKKAEEKGIEKKVIKVTVTCRKIVKYFISLKGREKSLMQMKKKRS